MCIIIVMIFFLIYFCGYYDERIKGKYFVKLKVLYKYKRLLLDLNGVYKEVMYKV